MIQYLSHKCRYCGNVARMQKTDGIVTGVQGGRLYRVGWNGQLSQRLVVCTANVTDIHGLTYKCLRGMRVTSFKEDIL